MILTTSSPKLNVILSTELTLQYMSTFSTVLLVDHGVPQAEVNGCLTYVTEMMGRPVQMVCVVVDKS